MIRIIPRDGLKVINPETLKKVPKEGIVVHSLDTYWKARKKDGDIKVESINKKVNATPKKEGNK